MSHRSVFQPITGKLGNMRKSVEWVTYPARDNSEPDVRIIQSDNRIARVNLTTKKAMLSKHAKNNGFMHLLPIMGATEVDCPQDIIDQLNSYTQNVGPVNVTGG